MKKIILSFIAVVFVAVLCCGCNQAVIVIPGEDDPSAEKEHYYNPLTNMEVAGPISNRIIAVSIDNHPDARPQYGVNDADIVYEVPAEGMIPRLVAIFYANVPDQVGGVRSARPYIVNIAREWGALMVHCGGSQEALSYLSGGIVDDMNEIGNGSYFWRDNTQYAPHNLMIYGKDMYKYLRDKGYATVSENVRQLNFRAEDQPAAGEPVDRIRVKFSYADNEYIYDNSIGCYYRVTDGERFTDKSNNDPVHVANLIIQRVTSSAMDSYGRLNIDMCAGGEAWLFTAGKMVHGSWSRAGLDSPTVFVDDAGEEFALSAGQTWIEIADQNVSLTYENTSAIADSEQQEL